MQRTGLDEAALGQNARRGRRGRGLVALALAAALAACVYVPEEAQVIEIPQEEPPQRPSAPMVGKIASLPTAFTGACDIAVSSVWIENPGGTRIDRQVYMLSGESRGVDCSTAELKLSLRAPNGRVLWRDSFQRAQLFGFEEVEDPEQMRGRLIDWITNYGRLNRTTRQLPTWPVGWSEPDVGTGNPFVPAQDITQEEYEEIRQARRPLYCYTAGANYWKCFALIREDNEIRFLGLQSFKPE